MLPDKWIFVTSGESGMGAGIVNQLTDEGYKVIFTYRTQKDKAREIYDEVRKREISACIIIVTYVLGRMWLIWHVIYWKNTAHLTV